MTARRANIAASLAARGRPELWANEQESAVLSGMSPEQFAKKVEALEVAGFPKPNSWNDKRFIPHIVGFWDRGGAIPEHANGNEVENDDIADKERWENDKPDRSARKRRAS